MNNYILLLCFCLSILLVVFLQTITFGAAEVVSPKIHLVFGQQIGTAPFTVHTTTKLNHSDIHKFLFQWDFGEEDSIKKLEGFNAAHTYRTAGVYTITLCTIYNESEWITTQTITVLPNINTKIYISSKFGNDNNDGTITSPIKTINKAQELLEDYTSLLFKRGDTFPLTESLIINNSNIVISSYGEGAEPKLLWLGDPITDSAFVKILKDSINIDITNLELFSAQKPTLGSVRGFNVKGKNIVIKGCHFINVGTALMTEQPDPPIGLFSSFNNAEILGEYYLWGDGEFHCHAFNVVLGSVTQHNIRFVGNNILLYGNLLTNYNKTCIWLQEGNEGYVCYNIILGGNVRVGPIRDQGEPIDRFRYAVINGNFIDQGGVIEVQHGSQSVLMNSNIIRKNQNHAIEIDGRSEVMDRTSEDIAVYCNTAIIDDSQARFIRITADPIKIEVIGNVFAAPNMITGAGGSANTFILDEDLSEITFYKNLWTEPDELGWGDGHHYLWPIWSNVNGFISIEDWEAITLENGSYRNFTSQDFDENYYPQFLVSNIETPLGSYLDFYQNKRLTTTPKGAVINTFQNEQ